MGCWLSRFLLNEGFEVIIADKNEAKLRETAKEIKVTTASSNADAVSDSDAVIISVPISRLEETISKIAPAVRAEQVIFDVTSVKTLPLELMHRYLGEVTVLGTHPVFGPGAGSIKHHNFVLTPTNETENKLAISVQNYLTERGACVSLMSPQAHDKLMSIVLGMAHFIAIASADTIAGFGSFQELKTIGGVTFRALLTLIESVISEDPALYASIQMSLPQMSQAHENFQKSVSHWAETVKSKDQASFVQDMSRLKDYFEKSDPDFGDAYRGMYRLVEGK